MPFQKDLPGTYEYNQPVPKNVPGSLARRMYDACSVRNRRAFLGNLTGMLVLRHPVPVYWGRLCIEILGIFNPSDPSMLG